MSDQKQDQPEVFIDHVVFNRDQLATYAERFKDYEGGPLPYIAQAVAAEIETDLPDYLNYRGLRDGTAKIFDLDPVAKGLPPEKRAMTDEDIISFLAVGPDGEPIQRATRPQGFLENIVPELGSMAGFSGGVAAGLKLQAGIPPAGPYAILGKAAIPIFTGLLGAAMGRSGVETVQDAVVGEQDPIMPGSTPEYEAGKTAATITAFLPTPFMLPKMAQTGAAQYLSNLRDARQALTGGAKIKPTGPLTAEQQAIFNALPENQAARLVAGKGDPLSVRLLAFTQRMLGEAGEAARAKPVRTLAGEVLPGTGAVIGAEIAEREAPGEIFPRIALETVGGVTGAVIQAPVNILANNIENIGSSLRNIRENFRRAGLRGVINPLVARGRTQAANRILKILESEGQDIDEIIRLLSNNEFAEYLVDKKGDPIQLTAGAKTTNPVLLAIEASLENMGTGLGGDRAKAGKQAVDALRNVVAAMTLSGDKDALQQAGVISQQIFDAELTQNLTNATDRVLQAFKNVTPSKESNMQLSEALFDVVKIEMEKARKRESELWKQVDEETFTSFLSPDGETVDNPNFLMRWEALLPETPEARQRIEEALPALTRFVRRKQEEFSPGEEVISEATTRLTGQDQKRLDALQSGVEKAQAKVQSNLEKLDAGKRTSNVQGLPVTSGNFSEQIQTALNGVVRADSTAATNFDSLSPPEQINYLNQLERYLGGQETPLTELDLGLINPLKKLQNASAGDRRNMVSFLRNRRTLLEKQQELANFQSGIATRPTPEAAPVELAQLSTTELTDMRAVALDLGRELSAKVEGSNAARVAYAFADELLDELERQKPEGMESAYDAARTYSRAFNDTFTRSFAYLVRDKTRSGANRKAPELMAEELFKGSSDATYLRLQEINEIGQFAQEQGLEGAEDTINTLAGINERLLRNASQSLFDPETSEISPRRLATWLDQNEATLQYFPDLVRDLQDAESAKLLLDQTSIANKNRAAEVRQQASFVDLLPETTENPTTAVARALSTGNKRPFNSMNEFIQIIRQAPEDVRPEALSGLKSSIIEWALTKGGRTGSTFSPVSVYRSIFEPLPKAETSLAKWMVGNDVIEEKELNQLRTFLREMVRYEVAEKSGNVENLIENTGPILDFYVRLAGASVGAKAAGMVGGASGSSLVAAGAGSRVFRTIVDKIPAIMQTDVMLEMMRNPQLLASMLRVARNQKEEARLASTLQRMLASLGFTPFQRTAPAIERERQREDVTQEMMDRYVPQTRAPAAPPVQPPLAPPQAMAQPPMSPPMSPPQAAPNLQQRQQYAAMFPYEATSEMIRGGIGSLT